MSFYIETAKSARTMVLRTNAFLGFHILKAPAFLDFPQIFISMGINHLHCLSITQISRESLKTTKKDQSELKSIVFFLYIFMLLFVPA